MLFWAGVLASPIPSEITEDEKELIAKVEVLAEKYGQDPVLVLQIMKCESGLRQDAVNENKKDGEVWSKDWGLLQINDYWHEETAKRLGFDIHTEDGNLEYGMWLMSREGVKPWSASRKCQDELSTLSYSPQLAQH